MSHMKCVTGNISHPTSILVTDIDLKSEYVGDKFLALVVLSPTFFIFLDKGKIVTKISKFLSPTAKKAPPF